MAAVIFGVVLAGWLITLSVVDWHAHRLPDFLTLPGAALINLWALLNHPWWILGGIAWALVYFLSALFIGGVGGGDIKFALGLGTLAASDGIFGWICTVVGASVLSLSVALVIRLLRNTPLEKIPHGPAMASAFLISLFLGKANNFVMGWPM